MPSWAFITMLGGWTVVLSTIFVFLSEFLSKKIFQRWNQVHEKNLEFIKGQIGKSNLMIESILADLSSKQSDIRLRKIDSIERMWRALIFVKNAVSPAVFFFSILTPEELEKTKANSKFEFVSHEQLSKALKDSDVEDIRPFLDDDIYFSFFSYRAFLGRIGYLQIEGKGIGKFQNWKTDSVFQQMLRKNFSEEQVKSILELEFGSLQMAIQYFEERILNYARSYISGASTTKENLLITRNMAGLIQNTSNMFNEINYRKKEKVMEE